MKNFLFINGLLYFILVWSFSLTNSSISNEEFSTTTTDCNDAICGPKINECTEIGSCNCSMTPDYSNWNNCICCKQCFRCLGALFFDCCPCLGLCRPRNILPVSISSSRRSSVSILNPQDDQINLFELITEESLHHDKWTVKTFPAYDNSLYDELNITQHQRNPDLQIRNCTVAFFKQCLSLEKCETVCKSMGASSYRWFHTGCCECVGKTCINFGWLEGLCETCRDLEQEIEEETRKLTPIDGEL